MKTALVALALLAVGVAAGIATTVLVLDDEGGRGAGSGPTATEGSGDTAGPDPEGGCDHADTSG